MSTLAIPSRYKANIWGSRSWRWSSLASKAYNRMSMVVFASGSGSGCGWWCLLGLGAIEQNLWKYEKSRSCVAFSNGGTKMSTSVRLQRWVMRKGWPRAALPAALAHRWISFAINCLTSITRPVRMVYKMVARPSVRSDAWEHGDMLACINTDQKRASGWREPLWIVPVWNPSPAKHSAWISSPSATPSSSNTEN